MVIAVPVCEKSCEIEPVAKNGSRIFVSREGMDTSVPMSPKNGAFIFGIKRKCNVGFLE
jgi:hypothetical protein